MHFYDMEEWQAQPNIDMQLKEKDILQDKLDRIEKIITTMINADFGYSFVYDIEKIIKE